MEVTNRFRGLDLIDRVPDELRMEAFNIVHEAVIKTIPKKRNAKGQNGFLRRRYKWLRKEEKEKEKEKRKVNSFECRVPEKSKERKEKLFKLTMK